MVTLEEMIDTTRSIIDKTDSYPREQQDLQLREQQDLYLKLLSLYDCADFAAISKLHAEKLNQLKDLVTQHQLIEN